MAGTHPDCKSPLAVADILRSVQDSSHLGEGALGVCASLALRLSRLRDRTAPPSRVPDPLSIVAGMRGRFQFDTGWPVIAERECSPASSHEQASAAGSATHHVMAMGEHASRADADDEEGHPEEETQHGGGDTDEDFSAGMSSFTTTVVSDSMISCDDCSGGT